MAESALRALQLVGYFVVDFGSAFEESLSESIVHVAVAVRLPKVVPSVFVHFFFRING